MSFMHCISWHDICIILSSTGELKKIKIEHDNSGLGPDWYLERVEISNMGTNLTTVFPCGNWLSSSRGDKETAREINAKTD